MIAKMKKVTLFVLDNEREVALKNLRKLGLVHINVTSVDSATVTELKAIHNKALAVQTILKEAAGKKAKKNKKAAGKIIPNTTAYDNNQTQALIDEITALAERKKEINAETARIVSTINMYSGFGDFNPADFLDLKRKGVTLALASAAVKQYNELFVPDAPATLLEKSDLSVIKLATEKTKIMFLIAAGAGGIPADIDSSITVLPLPEKSTPEYSADLKVLKAELSTIESKLSDFAVHIPAVQSFIETIAKRIEFETVYASMDTVDLQEDEPESKGLCLAELTGFIPASDCDKLKAAAHHNAWAVVSDDPTEEDLVPTKLQGNAVTRMIHPLFNFLNMFPSYFEFDVSWSVLLFFGIFTAMIFGDAGYGCLVLVVGIIMALKMKRSGKKVSDQLRLLLYLAAMTIVWGTLACSWFGINTALVPAFLRNLSIEGLVDPATKNSNIMFVSFTIGVVHLVLAHVIAIFTGKKNLKILAGLGSIAMLIGMYCVILNLIVSAERFPLHNWMLISIGAGFVLDFTFSNYDGSIGAGILASLKDSISKILGLVNVFSDIMSYVRLWAVGLAGASISMAVNSIAGPMLGNALVFIFGVLICVFGHGLNMALNVLSVVVHAVRLNSMEFSGHAGLAWSGIKYKPFAE